MSLCVGKVEHIEYCHLHSSNVTSATVPSREPRLVFTSAADFAFRFSPTLPHPVLHRPTGRNHPTSYYEWEWDAQPNLDSRGTGQPLVPGHLVVMENPAMSRVFRSL